ncbi:hypothetical protein ACFQLX_15335 [Streptomyces polyrhachis]|uniref:Helix-turn-helix domain-containing protein n=1 Tax=Streptomyces polyrhachis TaxID=1282885 RepID=A0ABW2GFK6_9ACTN
MIHLTVPVRSNFVIIPNHLAQRLRNGLAVAIATYMLSSPPGTPVSIDALCEHFEEGEIRIARALHRLEEEGYLVRRRERLPSGRFRTSTYIRNVPEAYGGLPTPDAPVLALVDTEEADPPLASPQPDEPPAAPPAPAEPAEPVDPPAPTEPDAPRGPVTLAAVATSAEPPGPPPPVDPAALAFLTALRRTDPRLILTAADAASLAPQVAAWFAAGVDEHHLTGLLANGLPRPLLRPARLLAYRLKNLPLPLPEPPPRATVAHVQTCGTCGRPFHSPHPGTCPDCTASSPHPYAAPEAETPTAQPPAHPANDLSPVARASLAALRATTAAADRPSPTDRRKPYVPRR